MQYWLAKGMNKTSTETISQEEQEFMRKKTIEFFEKLDGTVKYIRQDVDKMVKKNITRLISVTKKNKIQRTSTYFKRGIHDIFHK